MGTSPGSIGYPSAWRTSRDGHSCPSRKELVPVNRQDHPSYDESHLESHHVTDRRFPPLWTVSRLPLSSQSSAGLPAPPSHATLWETSGRSCGAVGRRRETAPQRAWTDSETAPQRGSVARVTLPTLVIGGGCPADRRRPLRMIGGPTRPSNHLRRFGHASRYATSTEAALFLLFCCRLGDSTGGHISQQITL